MKHSSVPGALQAFGTQITKVGHTASGQDSKGLSEKSPSKTKSKITSLHHKAVLIFSKAKKW